MELKTIIFKILLIFSVLPVSAQIVIKTGTSLGLLQAQLYEPTRIQDRNKYNFSVAPNISAEAVIPKTDLKLGLNFAYSFSKITVFVGGEPLFLRNQGFPKIHLNNDHFESEIYLSYPIFNNQKIKFWGTVGSVIGVPKFIKKTASTIEGLSTTTAFGSNYELHYLIGRSNFRNSICISSGLGFDLNFNKATALSFSTQFRLGLRQSVAYLYLGEIYINNPPDPLYDRFETIFSNSGFFLNIGLKYTLLHY